MLIGYPDKVMYYGGHPLMPKLEEGRLRPIGAELVFFSKDLKKKFFAIPLHQIQSVVVEQQKLSPSQKRGGHLYAAPSLSFFAKDSVYVSFLDDSDLLHKAQFATRYNDGAVLKLEIEDRVLKTSSLSSSPLAIARGNLIYILLKGLADSKLRPLHSYYRFKMPWDAKIFLVLCAAIALAVFFVNALPR